MLWFSMSETKYKTSRQCEVDRRWVNKNIHLFSIFYRSTRKLCAVCKILFTFMRKNTENCLWLVYVTVMMQYFSFYHLLQLDFVLYIITTKTGCLMNPVTSHPTHILTKTFSWLQKHKTEKRFLNASVCRWWIMNNQQNERWATAGCSN